MSEKSTNNQRRFYNIFKDEYLSKIDDFYEAKYEFLKDLNQAFKKYESGSNYGFVCRVAFSDELKRLKELLD